MDKQIPYNHKMNYYLPPPPPPPPLKILVRSSPQINSKHAKLKNPARTAKSLKSEEHRDFLGGWARMDMGVTANSRLLLGLWEYEKQYSHGGYIIIHILEALQYTLYSK